MRSICVFAGANAGNTLKYQELTRELARSLLHRGLHVVFGAGKVGLMGILAEETLAQGGTITGVVPRFLKQMEVCHEGLTQLIEVDTMHQRKQIMAEMSDAFLVLPGGFGTLDEFFEILTWKQLDLHRKPIGLLNHDGYYDHLIAHLDHMVAEGFLRPKNRELVVVEREIGKLLDALEASQPHPSDPKWIQRS